MATPDDPSPGHGPPRPALTADAQELPESAQVLLLIDYINPLQFEESSELAPKAIEAAKATAALKSALTQRAVQTVYANDNYRIWHSEFRDVLRYCEELPGAPAELARTLEPGRNDLTLLKPRHSAFFGTPLALLLREMRTRRLILTGLAADICVQFTAMDAYLRGYELWIPADCTASERESDKRASLEYMQRVLRADIRPARDVIARP